MAKRELIGGEIANLVAQMILIAAALNTAAGEFFDTDLLVDVMELTGQELQLAYGVIGVVAIVAAYNLGVENEWWS